MGLLMLWFLCSISNHIFKGISIGIATIFKLEQIETYNLSWLGLKSFQMGEVLQVYPKWSNIVKKWKIWYMKSMNDNQTFNQTMNLCTRIEIHLCFGLIRESIC